MMMKHNLRAKIRTIRKTLTQTEADNNALVALFQAKIPLKPTQIIAAYQKMGSEIDPKPILQALTNQIVFPTTQNNTKTLYFDGKSPDIYIIPLIAFDRQGNRLGQGGGYYDTTLANTTALKIGLAFAQQEVPHIPTEPHDQKLDWIITPKEAIKTT